MKRIKLQMNILMGAAISLCLSAIGNLRAEHFTLKSFLICFVISFAVSMLIGFWIPVKPLADLLIRELGIPEHTLGAKCFSALTADLIYTPIITVIMVLTAYIQASVHGAQIPLRPMLLSALVISMIAGFVLIFLLQPLFLKLVFKLNGEQQADDQNEITNQSAL